MSEIGSASQIAKVWFAMKCGRIQMQGMRITPWRKVERITAVHGRPMDWKYVVATTLMPIVQIIQFETVRSCAAMPRSAGLSDATNIDARSRGSGGMTCTAQARTHRAVVTQYPRTSVSFTLR